MTTSKCLDSSHTNIKETVYERVVGPTSLKCTRENSELMVAGKWLKGMKKTKEKTRGEAATYQGVTS